MLEVELHDEVAHWLIGLDDDEWERDGCIVLLTTFRKQRQNERTEVARGRKVAADCARRYP